MARRSRTLHAAVVLSLAGSACPIAQADDAATTTQLPKITVTGEHETDGYLAGRSRTATKTDTPLLEVPQSISVVTRDLVRDLSMQNLADVARYVPGAGMAQGEGNRDAIILRGNSSTSDFFVDGVRDDVEYFRDLYNLDRVEVLKGPNAMIFGRGGAGGVVNRVTRQANWAAVRELSVQTGSWDNTRATFDLGNGISEAFAARITGVYEDSESYRDGFELEKKGVNPTAAFALGDRTLVRLSYEYFDYDRIADRGIPSLDGRPFPTTESTFFGDPSQSPTHATVNQGTIVVDHAFADNVKLRNRTQYSDYDKFYQNVFAGGEVDAASGTVQLSAYNNEQLRENVFNQTDLLIGFDAGGIHHDFLAGVELGEQVTDNFRNTGLFNDSEDPYFVSAADPTVSVPVTYRQSETDADNHGRATIAAAYVQDQIVLSPHWEAVLGLRFDQFDMDFTNNRTGDRFRTSDELLSPRAGVIFKPQETTALYASYSMTHIPRAGAQLNQLSLTNEALDPEEFENVEVGVKWDARPGLALTAALFQLDRKNVAIPHPTIPEVLILVDAQRSEGLEFGVSGRISDAWSIQGGYAWQQGELSETASNIPGGAQLAQLPKHAASLWNKLDLTPQWGLGLGVIHQTEMFAAIAPAEDLVTLPEFTRVDAAVFYTPNERLRVQANVENLFDEQYYPNAHNNNNISPGSPLAVRVGVTVSF